MPGSLAITEVDSEQEFGALAAEWNALVERDPRATFFQLFEFQYHTWKILADEVSPCLVLLRDGEGRLIGCAPFGTRRVGRGPLSARTLEFASPRYCDYQDLILDPEHAAEAKRAIADWLDANAKRFDVVRLRSVRDGAWLLDPDLQSRLGEHGRRVEVEKSSTAPFLTIQAGWTSYQDALTKKRAKSMRYEVKNLGKKLDVQFARASEGAALDRAFEHFVDLHQRRMAQKNQPGHFGGEPARRGFRALLHALGARDIAGIHTLTTPEAAVAVAVTFRFRGTSSFFLGGFDPDQQRLSPGKVIQALIITEAIEEGASEYDFLFGDEPYKLTWASGERSVFDVEILTGSWRRVPYAAWNATRARLAGSERVRSAVLGLRRGLSRLRG